MLWKWTDADKQKLSKALELMEYILHQLGLSAGKIVVSHKDYRGLSVPDISPELKQLSIKLMNLEQIAPVEILVALQINPALLDITLPTGLEQLCNLMVNNTLDYYRAWLWAFRNIRSSFAQAWSVDSSSHVVVGSGRAGNRTPDDEDPFRHLDFFEREQLRNAYAQQYNIASQAPPVSSPPGNLSYQRHLPDFPQHSMQKQQHGQQSGGDAFGALIEYLVSKPSSGP